MYQLKRIKDLYNPRIHHFRFIEPNSRSQGVGSAHSEEIAKQKAISEYFESKIAKINNSYFTTGISVHPNKNESVIKSQLELIERHYFFMSWFQGRYPEWIDITPLNKDYQFHLGLIAKNENVFVTCALLISNSNKIAFMLLLAAEKSIEECRDKLVLDSHRMMTLIERSNLNDLKAPNYFKTPIDHTLYYLNPTETNFNLVKDFTSNSQSPLWIIDKHQFEFQTTCHNFYGRRYATISKCNEMITYFLGTPNHLNFHIPKNRNIHPIG